MTELSSIQIAKLTAVITGGGFKRSATKADAIKRFLKVAAEKGIDGDAILAADDPTKALTEWAMRAPLSPTTGKGGPGLARLRKAADAEAIRNETNADADAARAKARKDMPATEPKDRRTGVDTVPAPKAVSRSRLAPTAKIASVVANPKKAGSRSHARFALYRAGATVGEFVAACVAAGYPASEANADLSWDRRKGFIKIEVA